MNKIAQFIILIGLIGFSSLSFGSDCIEYVKTQYPYPSMTDAE